MSALPFRQRMAELLAEKRRIEREIRAVAQPDSMGPSAHAEMVRTQALRAYCDTPDQQAERRADLAAAITPRSIA